MGGDRRGPTAAASCAPRSPSCTPAGRQLGCAQREELGPYSVCVMAVGTAVEQVFVPKGRGGLSPSFSLVAALTRWRQCLGEGHLAELIHERVAVAHKTGRVARVSFMRPASP
jgi:hypothetical protein